MYKKNDKNKCKMLSIWSKFCLTKKQPRIALEVNYHMSELSKIKDAKIIQAAHDKLPKSSAKHTFLRGTRKDRSNKQHDASTFIRTFILSNMIKTTRCDKPLTP